MAVEAYRQLLRATKLAFKGDSTRLNAARFHVRKGFEDNRGLVSGSEEQSQQLLYANEVAKVLRENVVQGEFSDGERYKLRLHEHTERGDNTTIRLAKGRKNTLAGLTSRSCSS